MTSQDELERLQDRYPFSEPELEILLRSSCSCASQQDGDFLLTLAQSSPYATFFLPGDEMRHRIEWLQEHVLPPHFSKRLGAAVCCCSQDDGEEQCDEQACFLEGMSQATGRRGVKDALSILYQVGGDGDVVETACRLAVAAPALIAPTFEPSLLERQVAGLEPIVTGLNASLQSSSCEDHPDRRAFVAWAERDYPQLAAALATFVHHLVFHRQSSPRPLRYIPPSFEQSSAIFRGDNDSRWLPLVLSSSVLGGTVR